MSRIRARDWAWRRPALTACLLGLIWAALPAPADAKRNVYVSTGVNTGSIQVYDIGVGGALTNIQSVDPGTDNPLQSAFTPDGRFLFNAACGCPNVDLSSFSVGSNGLLTALPGSPQALGGQEATGAAVTPDGQHLYVSNPGDDTLTGFTIGPSGSLTPVSGSPIPTDSGPLGVAVTPDGRHLYLANTNASPMPSGDGLLSIFDIAANGSLTRLPDVHLDPNANPASLKITPDGRFLYVGDAPPTGEGPGRVWAYEIQADGTLLPVTNSPFPTNGPPGGPVPEDLAMTPGGDRLYAIGSEFGIPNEDIVGFNIASDGQLTTTPNSPYTAPNTAPGMSDVHLTVSGAVSPDGSHLFVANTETVNSTTTQGSVAPLSINADGSLTGGTAVTISNTDGLDMFSTSITPNQPPNASFTATPAEAGVPTGFDASGTTDSDSTVATYAWDFGDGTGFTGSSPTQEHPYAQPGTYTATLTVADNEGCSTSQVYTGQMPLCNGSQVAQTTRTVTVTSPPPPVVSDPSVHPYAFAVDPNGLPAKAKPKLGTTIRYTLSEDAAVTFKVENQTKGRLVHGKCERPSKKNRKHRHCLRFKTAGYFTQNGVQGRNKLRFSGKVSTDPPNNQKGRFPDTLTADRWLRTGTYRLTIQATNGTGQMSTIRRLSFKVVRL